MTDVDKVYAAEVARRLEEFVSWTRDNWPVPSSPLLDSDFEDARRMVHLIVGERLEQARSADELPEPSQGGPQYRPVNPAPWP
jgi:hypothetical protein